MDLDDKFTLGDLLEACLAYDKEHGSYPESPEEGEAVYEFVKQYLDDKAANAYLINEERVWLDNNPPALVEPATFVRGVGRIAQ